MFDDRNLAEERIERFHERLGMQLYRVVAPLEVTAWQAPGEPVSFAEAMEGEYSPMSAGDRWGPAWSTWWFRVNGTIPEEARAERVELRMDLGFVGDWAGNQSEGLVFTGNGYPLKGLNPMNRTVPLTFGDLAGERMQAGDALVGADGSMNLIVEAGANPNMGDFMNNPTDMGDRLTAPDKPVWTFGGAELVVRNDAVWHLWLDVEVLFGLMKELPQDSTLRAVILRGLEEAADAVDSVGLIGGANRGRELLAPLIASGAGRSAQQVSAVGHAHIDSAWLWPLRETRRKVARTFSNVLALAEEYPDFHFACTSAQHYAWLQEGSPELFECVKACIDRGQWHVVGGMWVESDTNLPGGEALVRQFTAGLRWMQRELGERPTCLWLPDSFGYTGALPQIAKLAGMTTFFTQKLSWNQTNTLPHHTFWWEGIDGSRIFTHFPPVDCYDSIVSPEEVAKAERNFKEKGRASASLLPFGYGDGGGGPVREMVERVHRFADMEGAPALSCDTPDSFFDKARAEYPNAPVWAGEMYLEFHRGVYTSQAELKRGNREVEAMLAMLEWLGTEAERLGAEYPSDEVETLWQRMLLLQFHDILPGSSTSWVNRDAREEYDTLRTRITELIDAALADIARVGTRQVAGTLVVNAAPHPRREVVGDGTDLSFVDVGSLAIAPLEDAERVPTATVSLTRTGDTFTLSNGLVSVEIGADGTLTSVRDLTAHRELLAPGQRGNLLTVHPDHPSCFDAWELQHHYRRTAVALDKVSDVRVATDTPLRARVEVVRTFGKSAFTQVITLDADSRAVDFEVRVDWHERHQVLRVGFPLAINAARDRSEIQFGHIDRSIAPNTSWDEARFEVSGHRWCLLEEPGYAVGFANSQTYGHDVQVLSDELRERRAGIRFGYTLLRSPEAPDPTSDTGTHSLRYSIVCGASLASAHEAGLRLTQPLQLRDSGAATSSTASIEPREGDTFAIIDSVKLAFDGSGDLIIRLHEAEGRAGTAHVQLGLDAVDVSEVDLLEGHLGEQMPSASPELDADTNTVTVSLHAFQITTLRMVTR